MFVCQGDSEEKERPFANALKCAIAAITDKIITSEDDIIGICFYGTVLLSFYVIFISSI